MIYLANPRKGPVADAMSAGRIGAIEAPGGGSKAPDGAVWCADNGCYGKGWPGEEAWFRWLASRADRADSCLFATAPDVVGDAEATFERSRPWLARIRSLGFPAAFVAQDGLENLVVPWGEFDVLFIGGTTEWKLGAAARDLVAEAKRRGKWVHMGRVNSGKRWGYASMIGCDSADGTYLTFGADVNLPKLIHWTRDDLFTHTY